MKKHFILSIIFIFTSINTNAQFGAEENEVDNLLHLCKAWGFVKYFHPEVKDCTVEWDAVLLEALEELEGADQADYNNIIEAMIDEAGVLPETTGTPPEPIEEEELNNLDLNWLESQYFSEAVQGKLLNIYEESKYQNHCLLEPVFSDGPLSFDNELTYSTSTYPSIYYRVLAVFRYWNAIEYFFPYKHIMDQNWNTSFEQFVLPIVYSDNSKSYLMSFKAFTAQINDSHSFFDNAKYYQYRGFELPPFVMRFVEGETIITKVHETVTELAVGDIVRSLDGVPIQHLRDSIRLHTSGSNDITIERNITREITWGPNDFLDITVEKADGSLATIENLYRNYDNYIDLHFDDLENPQSPSWEIIEGECGNYGYVNMGLLVSGEILPMISELWDMEAIIFDVRNYPNGTLFILVHYLFNHPIVAADFTAPKESYPGHFYWSEAEIGSYNSNYLFDGLMLILFDEYTQSHAEYTIMGLEQYPNAIKIGSQTAGADGNVTSIPLPGQINAYFTGLGTYYEDHTPTQRIGIVPDIEVTPSIEGIRNEVDEVLEVALDCLLLTELENTSIASISESPYLSVYPNPTKDILYIENSKNLPLQLTVLDLQGKPIFEATFKSDYTLDVTQWLDGIYSLIINDEKRVFVDKLVKY